ncbi:tripartite tricarboxylate transporter TctB family protein [Roseomonas sp. KE0001]|uniref:tripartite tricarboxylate transporter TctB family protein n=1 Tax=Roseomonas sp. KE0001 TaxID=2479201 RepID=UPI0018E02BF4|nr:tripartite tricarboxylate transporter TctB family protein [Roseomonas sp. KE0001]
MMTRTARGVALGGLVFAALAWWEASRLESWSWDGPGPGLMPQALSILIALAALAVLVWPGDPTAEAEGGAAPFRDRTFLAYVLAMLGAAAAVPFLGFVPPMLAATTLMLRLGERSSWTEALLYALLLAAGIVLLFGTALGVPFPTGPVERVLSGLGLLRGS